MIDLLDNWRDSKAKHWFCNLVLRTNKLFKRKTQPLDSWWSQVRNAYEIFLAVDDEF